ncbi:hypothetical protein AK812_SmicGene15600 [Symbiodinium microadriaticum]|uniref:Uncharacterized protein n=1 Tax=Symbiodinium microadriaticum TaxID=2951 RepID=A0A1Q9E2I7_SYMMI|nr:hypothetical protein AK812_SmicGene15600 [Symbiodinium microadriaticum]
MQTPSEERLVALLDQWSLQWTWRGRQRAIGAGAYERYCTLGLYAFGGNAPNVSKASSMKEACIAVNRFMRHRFPHGTWTSIAVLLNPRIGLHRDMQNMVGKLNHAITLGTFNGGRVWIEDNEGTSIETTTKNGKVRELKGTWIDIHGRVLERVPAGTGKVRPVRVAPVAEPLAEKKKQLPKGASLQQVQKMLRFLRGTTPFPELRLGLCNASMRSLAAWSRWTRRSCNCGLRADEPDAAEDIAEEEPAAEEPEDLVDEDLVEDLEEESPEEDAVVEPDAQQVEKMRVLGQPGFDIEIQGAVATVLGDEHEIYQDGRKCGEPAEVTMVPKMVYDRRGGQAFDVHGQIAAVRRVVLRTPAPEKLLGFPCWAFGDKDFLVVSDFEALLTAEPLPFQKIKRVETTGEQGELALGFVHGIVVEA